MMTVYEAVKQSYNTVAVRVGSYVGVREMYDFVTETLGIELAESDMDYAPLVLGATTTGMSPYDLAAAYMMYGSGGKYTTPHTYTTVEDYKGNVILKKEITTVQAIGEDTAYVMNRLFEGRFVRRGRHCARHGGQRGRHGERGQNRYHQQHKKTCGLWV